LGIWPAFFKRAKVAFNPLQNNIKPTAAALIHSTLNVHLAVWVSLSFNTPGEIIKTMAKTKPTQAGQRA